jgi:DNA polymerase III subunit epsilon
MTTGFVPNPRGYMILDLENSGLFLFNEVIDGKKVSVPADDPRQPRLAELGIIFTDSAFRYEREYTSLVKRDGWSMTAGATEVNGITDERLDREGRPLAEVLQVYTNGILGEGRHVITYHAQNDTKQLRGELRRVGMDDLFEVTLNTCAMRSVQGAKLGIKKLNGKGGYPRLVDVCAHFGLPQEPEPHSAINGCRALLPVVCKLHELGALIPSAVHRSAHKQED